MRIAIIGSGIAGNVAAYHLHREHDITVFEAGGHIGGHTHTHVVQHEGREVAVDTGFIVFNDWTYPNFIRLLKELGVEAQESEMSFSVKCTSTGLEYNGTTVNSLFAQRRNLLRPSFWRMIRDILRFNREAPALLHDNAPEVTLGEYLQSRHYSAEFTRNYILPMGAAIWSSSTQTMLQFPARFFVRFFHNHGMLSVDSRPTWRTIRDGSARYAEKLTASFRDRIRLNSPVESVQRTHTHVLIKPQWGDA
jgi:predicted NAD/FAD-binding protein